MAVIELRGLRKVYPNGVEAVAGVDLAVAGGEFLVVVGPSGSGKSTLLRLVAGLEEPSGGSVWIGGRDVTGLAPRARDLAMVFQEPALYPYLSVARNLAFGLRARRVGRAEVRARVGEVAGSLGLTGLLGRRPGTLSGGQKRRVALGRAVARRPAAYLFDEPLTGLDAPLRASVLDDLLALHRSSRAAMLYVTHDQAEALATGDRVAVMDRGRVVQVGTPRAVYERPETRFVAGFLGSPPMNVVPCRAAGRDVLEVVGAGEGARFAVAGDAPGRVDLGLRPEHVAIAPAGGAQGPPLAWLPGTFEVARVEYLGHEAIATVALGPTSLRVRREPHARFEAGDAVAVGLDLSQAAWFDHETGRAATPRLPGGGPEARLF